MWRLKKLETAEAYALATVGAIQGIFKYYIKGPIMESLQEHEQEVSYEYIRSTGVEKRFIWNSLLGIAYTKVQDHQTKEEFTSIAPEGVHPKETFDHPFRYQVGDIAKATGVEIAYEEGQGVE